MVDSLRHRRGLRHRIGKVTQIKPNFSITEVFGVIAEIRQPPPQYVAAAAVSPISSTKS
ncbi:hypothetical protein [Sphingobium herbicidovorans]|uniref:hypothetical protein n=1 Tax=Sphingobium herbicidovorans TaxID=76947 RepID=UPI000A4AB65A|nr:hypothetical protein [Sphingobium herbicidovorans]